MRAKQKTYYEPYLDPEGDFGLAVLEDENEGVRLLDWNELGQDRRFTGDSKGKGGILTQLFPTFPKMIWPLPDKPPYLSNPHMIDDDLFLDVKRAICDHVWIQESEVYEPITSYAISTWISELNPIAPRLLVIGPTHSGKSRLLDVLELLVYRPRKAIDMRSSPCFHFINDYQTTIIVDEYHSIPKESRADFNAIIRAGFQRGYPIPRSYSHHNYNPKLYETFAPMVIGSQRMPTLDIENRSIVVYMQKDCERQVEREIDEDRLRGLSSRLLRFRLDAISGKVKLPTDEAHERALKEIFDHEDEPPRSIGLLSDRYIDIARTLGQVGLLWKCYDDTLLHLAKLEESTQEELKGQYDAIVFNALQGAIREAFREIEVRQERIDGIMPNLHDLKISLKDIETIAFQDLGAQGFEFKDKSDPEFKFKPTTIGKVLKALGFKTKRKAKGTFLEINDKFEARYENLKKRYGERGLE